MVNNSDMPLHGTAEGLLIGEITPLRDAMEGIKELLATQWQGPEEEDLV